MCKNLYRVIDPEGTFTWLFTGWPQGELVLTLTLYAGRDPSGKPAIVLDLRDRILPDFVRLELFCPPQDSADSNQIYITPESEGLCVLIEEDRYLLCQPHGNIVPEKLAVLEIDPDPELPEYDGIIPWVSDLAL